MTERAFPRRGAGRARLGTALLWIAAGAAVVGVHGVFLDLLVPPAAEAPASDTAIDGIVVDLEPLSVMQSDPTAPPAPLAGTTEPSPPEASDEQTQAAAPPPTPGTPDKTPPDRKPDEKPPETPPKPADTPEPPRELPPEQSRSAPPPPTPVSPIPPPSPEPNDATLAPPPPEKKPEPERRPPPKPRRDTAPSAPTEAQQGQNGAVTRSISASPAGVATWRGVLAAHLNRFKQAPPGRAAGTARVRFTIDGGGRVVEAQLLRTSGDAALDRTALAMIRRASPVPPPPPGLGAGPLSLSVPVHFN